MSTCISTSICIILLAILKITRYTPLIIINSKAPTARKGYPMGVSPNNHEVFPTKNYYFGLEIGGTPIFGNTHIYISEKLIWQWQLAYFDGFYQEKMKIIFYSLCQFAVSATGNRQQKKLGQGSPQAHWLVEVLLLLASTFGLPNQWVTIIVSWEIHWGKMFGVSRMWICIWVYVYIFYIHIILKLNMVNMGWINPLKKWHTHPGKQTWTQWTQHTPGLKGNSFSKPSIWNYYYCYHDYIVFMWSYYHYTLITLYVGCRAPPSMLVASEMQKYIVHSSIIL